MSEIHSKQREFAFKWRFGSRRRSFSLNVLLIKLTTCKGLIVYQSTIVYTGNY